LLDKTFHPKTIVNQDRLVYPWFSVKDSIYQIIKRRQKFQ